MQRGEKGILGLCLNETESKHKWFQIFDEIKARGVENIFFLSIDGVSSLEADARVIFPEVKQNYYSIPAGHGLAHYKKNQICGYIPDSFLENY